MFQQSKILVWYQVASQKVVLGEAFNSSQYDVHSLWRRTPEECDSHQGMGYRLSLFDDGGREIAGKAISMGTADQLLAGPALNQA
ncbi:30S ribosomal protein S6 modification protein [Vibrio panuliri]|uniref:30S ribosomal protein S6 modification protein n=1 Tax=Vibrio panuliri TaxID=1381081 RepID=A0A1Q9HIN9_9VIBR|nr:30S ribosomal protein S6 modification protein [Vibrio panuliri]KAB1454286.1 30S ribosomal protein S6 modification protein [Vibrio panuliri]OLQ86507.1 30S ribosomal protein S6 modification protein [Vibrio panuliri]OLQ90181.1 30S ribosomal protein S6 modification protein [Vibrio panuliri]